MMHHTPISKPARHFKRLVDGSEFRAALARQGAELVIHGHDHVHSLIEVEGPQERIPVVGAPSASAVAPGRNDGAALRGLLALELSTVSEGYSQPYTTTLSQAVDLPTQSRKRYTFVVMFRGFTIFCRTCVMDCA